MIPWVLLVVVSALPAFVHGKLKLNDAETVIGTKHIIRNICNLATMTPGTLSCSRQLEVTEDGYVSLSYNTHQKWEILEAEEGGYHVRSCDAQKCLYWLDSNIKGWDYMTLSKEPVTRFGFEDVGPLSRRLWEVKTRNGFIGESVHLTGTAYKIMPMNSTARKFVTYVERLTKSWLILDRKASLWVIEPKLYISEQ